MALTIDEAVGLIREEIELDKKVKVIRTKKQETRDIFKQAGAKFLGDLDPMECVRLSHQARERYEGE